MQFDTATLFSFDLSLNFLKFLLATPYVLCFLFSAYAYHGNGKTLLFPIVSWDHNSWLYILRVIILVYYLQSMTTKYRLYFHKV